MASNRMLKMNKMQASSVKHFIMNLTNSEKTKQPTICEKLTRLYKAIRRK